ncbi:glutaredoxin family protein [Cellulomonas sp. SG140]|uniref:glutaredoxin family protein n=1 Tax=Cellulomonas sp. SG140 TaxID=2976536 RepID=UPI002987FF58|nr:glutaredoxin domain-containing protein [Cellulomonas sp. SG140]
MSVVTVYSAPHCQPCNATKRLLDKLDIEHVVIDVSEDPAARDFALALGYQETPVVFIDTDNHWSGYRPDRIREYAREAQQ